MTLIDTHCHLHFPDFDGDRMDVLARAREAGVRYMINIGTDNATNDAAWNLSSSQPMLRHTAGLHPHHSHEIDDAGLISLEAFVRRTKPVAIGEIGLDYYKSEADPARQKVIFRHMLHLAQRHELPVVIHSRNAFEDTFEMLVSEGRGNLRGVIHCYSYGREALKKLLDIGFLVSFTATVTYKNTAELLEAARYVPADRMLIETDSPYLAPQVFRGKRNEPAFVAEVAAFLARERGVGTDELAEQTTRNATAFFGLPTL